MITVSGIIIPVGWDANGRVVEMAIATHKEEEYFIEDDHKDVELRSFLRQEVMITGFIKTKGRKKIIKPKEIAKKKIVSLQDSQKER